MNNKECRGLFIGLTGMDVVHYQDGDLPIENTKSKTNDYNVCVGGPAANAAITFAHLGGRPILITAIGDSFAGNGLKAMLEDDLHGA